MDGETLGVYKAVKLHAWGAQSMMQACSTAQLNPKLSLAWGWQHDWRRPVKAARARPTALLVCRARLACREGPAGQGEHVLMLLDSSLRAGGRVAHNIHTSNSGNPKNPETTHSRVCPRRAAAALGKLQGREEWAAVPGSVRSQPLIYLACRPSCPAHTQPCSTAPCIQPSIALAACLVPLRTYPRHRRHACSARSTGAPQTTAAPTCPPACTAEAPARRLCQGRAGWWAVREARLGRQVGVEQPDSTELVLASCKVVYTVQASQRRPHLASCRHSPTSALERRSMTPRSRERRLSRPPTLCSSRAARVGLVAANGADVLLVTRMQMADRRSHFSSAAAPHQQQCTTSSAQQPWHALACAS